MQQKKRSPDVLKAVGRIARAKLGYEQLRPGQEEAIAAVLAGHDTLAVMPTGSGKSAIYRSLAPSSLASPSWCRR
jgi:ATP-dependent DNA helicase RecQ